MISALATSQARAGQGRLLHPDEDGDGWPQGAVIAFTLPTMT